VIKIKCKGLLNIAKHLFQDSSHIVIIIDDNFKCRWVNKLGAKRFPALLLPEGLIELLKSEEIENILKSLKTGNQCTATFSCEPFNNLTFEFYPIDDNDEFCGSIVFMKTDLNEIFQSKTINTESVISIISNEYKMPLTIIFSTLGLMSRKFEKNGDDSMKEYMRIINQNSYKILRLSNNMNDILRYRLGLSDLNFKNGDICSFLTGLCNAVSVMTFPLDIPLVYKIPKEKIIISFDPNKLSIAFLNFISNSCKYTRPGNIINVKLEVLEKQIVITVADKGIGIQAAALKYIFEPYFTQSSDETTYGGVGLGLSISKYIITQHNGTIAVCSNESQGTSVAFTLPIIKDENLADYTAESSADYLDDRFSSLFVELCNVCNCPLP
jgi:signal transduction histidine kinase